MMPGIRDTGSAAARGTRPDAVCAAVPLVADAGAHAGIASGLKALPASLGLALQVGLFCVF